MVLLALAAFSLVAPQRGMAVEIPDPEVMAAQRLLHRRAPLDDEARQAVLRLLRHPKNPHLRGYGVCCVLVHRDAGLRPEVERLVGAGDPAFRDLARTAVALLEGTREGVPYFAQDNDALLGWMPSESIETPYIRPLTQEGLMLESLMVDLLRHRDFLDLETRRRCDARLLALAPPYWRWRADQMERHRSWRERKKEVLTSVDPIRGALLAILFGVLGALASHSRRRARASRGFALLAACAFVWLLAYCLVGDRVERPDPEPEMPPIGCLVGTPASYPA